MYNIYSAVDNSRLSFDSYEYYADAEFALQFFNNAYIDSFLFDGFEDRRGYTFYDLITGNVSI